jgi:hypothetical protein
MIDSQFQNTHVRMRGKYRDLSCFTTHVIFLVWDSPIYSFVILGVARLEV